MFLFIWVNYLNVSWWILFLEPSVFLYIAYFVELCFLAIFFAFGGNFAGLLCGFFFWPFGKMSYFSEDENFFIKSFLSWVEIKAWYCSAPGTVIAWSVNILEMLTSTISEIVNFLWFKVILQIIYYNLLIFMNSHRVMS